MTLKRTRTRDPRYCQIVLDANALDRLSPDRSAEVDEFLELTTDLSVIKPYGVEVEIGDARTPSRVRKDMDGIYTLPTSLSPEEQQRKLAIQRLMMGNSKSDKYFADADHLFHASKYGGGYFVTHDDRIKRRENDLQQHAPGIEIVTLSEMLDILRSFSGKTDPQA